jgi:hypothetical protein
MDWHSNVAGAWTLCTYTWMTGDWQFAPLLRNVLAEQRLVAERRRLRDLPQTFEMPYGRAWLLRLAACALAGDLLLEHTASAALRCLADDVAHSLVAWYAARSRAELCSLMAADDYANAAFAMLALAAYGAAVADDRYTRAATCLTLVTSTQVCAPSRAPRGEFMDGRLLHVQACAVLLRRAPCRRAARALLRLRPRACALNFSRCWLFHSLYELTRDARYRHQFVRHFTAGSPATIGHWVANFAMLALQGGGRTAPSDPP